MTAPADSDVKERGGMGTPDTDAEIVDTVVASHESIEGEDAFDTG
jgi:hypothetical protein